MVVSKFAILAIGLFAGHKTGCALPILATIQGSGRYQVYTRGIPRAPSHAQSEPRVAKAAMLIPCFARCSPSSLYSPWVAPHYLRSHYSLPGVVRSVRALGHHAVIRPEGSTRARKSCVASPPRALMSSHGCSPPDLHGVFAVYKPQGFTSADVVAKIKVSLLKPRGIARRRSVWLTLKRWCLQTLDPRAYTSLRISSRRWLQIATLRV